MDAGSTTEYLATTQGFGDVEMRSTYAGMGTYAAVLLTDRSNPFKVADVDEEPVEQAGTERSSTVYVEAIARSVPTTAGFFIEPISPLVLPSRHGATAMHSVMEAVRPFARLEAGWDGYDGVAPTSKAIDDAERFVIGHLYAFEKRRPRISPASDGEVNFCWRGEGHLLDLGFYGDGTYSYYAKLADGREFFNDDAPVDALLPEEIAVAIFAA
ncbi:hypothetical protein [Halopseudomonas maritima]|uniref:hypothetical protein n=1 Tax=Halopseudomonas maritima TaxID=2918528 RepID=UPI001EEC124B|nr:hypothetical protein [Halopseudomonas maritima]UJJ30245.1 hypothetical protein HV822_10595 [Halopseudomonas maritima]